MRAKDASCRYANSSRKVALVAKSLDISPAKSPLFLPAGLGYKEALVDFKRQVFHDDPTTLYTFHIVDEFRRRRYHHRPFSLIFAPTAVVIAVATFASPRYKKNNWLLGRWRKRPPSKLLRGFPAARCCRRSCGKCWCPYPCVAANHLGCRPCGVQYSCGLPQLQNTRVEGAGGGAIDNDQQRRGK